MCTYYPICHEVPAVGNEIEYLVMGFVKLPKLDGIKLHLDMTYGTCTGPILHVKSRYEVRISIHHLCHVLYSDLCDIMV
jgi:hypothetical protein